MARETEELNPADLWIHRSRGMMCATCIWWVQKVPVNVVNPSEPPMVIGRCRRHAPTMTGYPVVFGQDWCGDHKLDENQ
jgi:hypothetical protein